MMGWFRPARQSKNPHTIDGQDGERMPPDYEGEPFDRLPPAYLGMFTGGADTPRASPTFSSSSRSSTSETVRDVKCDVLANWLYVKAASRMWTCGHEGEGALVKKKKGNYAYYPPGLGFDSSGYFEAIRKMNVCVRILEWFSFRGMLTCDSVH
jgi:hypothetical protein